MKCPTVRISGASLLVTACLSLMAIAALLIPAAPQALAQYIQPTHHHPLPTSHRATAPLAHPALAPTPTVTPEGTWTPLANQAPENVGLMMLLTDGTVVASGNNGNLGTGGDNTWYKLTPDSQGHYVNGTWSQLTSMQYARLYVLSQILQNGKVFIAGGEYGNAPKGSAELYDPIANTWTALPNTTSLEPNASYVDGESMLLPNGNVLSYSVGGQNCQAYGFYTGDLFLYDPVANNFTATGCPLGNQDESSWVKLPDNSILALDLKTGGSTSIPTSAERYIPSTGQWIADAAPPVYLFNPGGELGGAFLLPNGNVFYIGGTNQTLIYTPSGTTAPGTWTQGPTFPDEGGAVVGANDAPAAMMANGKILITEGNYVSPCDYCTPTYFFVYDYQTNTISSINAPDGTASDTATASYQADMLDLPDGSVLYEGNSTQLYTFTPATPQVDAGKPVLTSVQPNPDGSYLLTGTGFNGISSGSDYGDENQNATNYPIVSLTNSSGNVYYARTYNWSSTGVATGNLAVTTDMTLPAGLPHGTYQLTVSANGIQSAPNTFSYLLAQTITFNPISSQVQGTQLALSASASSGLPVSFASLTTTVCTVSGTTATLISPGTCTIQATQAGNAQYAAATSVNQSFTVTPVTSSANFTITPFPPTETVKKGDIAAFILELQSVNGFNAKVTLSCSGGPAGSNCVDFPTSVNVNGKAFALSGFLVPKTTAPGVYTITFTGVSGSLTNKTTAKLTVK
jgi:hypothetical protein